MYIIYKLTDKNGLSYIGKTKDFKKRFSCHKCKSNKTTSRFLDSDSIEKEILEECDDEIAWERERYWINNTKCVNIMKLNYNDLEYKRKRNKWIRSWGTHYGADNNMFFTSVDLFS